MAESVIQRPLGNYQYYSFVNNSRHANITNVELGYVYILGRIAVGTINFTVGTAITGNNEVLFSGLPKGVGFWRFRLPSTTDNRVPIRLSINTDGNIQNQWSQGGIPTGTYEGSFSYIVQ